MRYRYTARLYCSASTKAPRLISNAGRHSARFKCWLERSVSCNVQPLDILGAGNMSSAGEDVNIKLTNNQASSGNQPRSVRVFFLKLGSSRS